MIREELHASPKGFTMPADCRAAEAASKQVDVVRTKVPDVAFHMQDFIHGLAPQGVQ